MLVTYQVVTGGWLGPDSSGDCWMVYRLGESKWLGTPGKGSKKVTCPCGNVEGADLKNNSQSTTQIDPKAGTGGMLRVLRTHEYRHEQSWCTHWLEEVPVWVYAFRVCKPVILVVCRTHHKSVPKTCVIFMVDSNRQYPWQRHRSYLCSHMHKIETKVLPPCAFVYKFQKLIYKKKMIYKISPSIRKLILKKNATPPQVAFISSYIYCWD